MNCPKCGTHISPFDLKPNCKNCGVNILIYSQEYLLERDAKLTELEFASARIILAKIKAAFIDGRLQIIRIITSLLCLASLLIPFAEFDINIPMFSENTALNGIGIYKMFSDGLLFSLPDFAGSTLFGGTVKLFAILIAAMLAVILTETAIVFSEILSFINIKKSAKAICILSVIGTVLCAIFYILGFIFTASAVPEYMSLRLGFGALATVLILALNFLVNLKISKTEIPLKLREYDLERKEILKKIKHGEMDFDELTLPVFETAEEKEARLKELEEILKSEKEDG